MRIRLDAHREPGLLDQARQQIVSALHAGLVHRGDRLPSIRSVATLSRLNIKTVLRIYERLQDEGLVTTRSGSGTFVTGQDPGGFDSARVLSLRRLLRRHLDEASAMNLTPGHYADLARRFVTRGALRSRSVAVLECNREQVRLFAREINLRLGVKAHPLLLADLRHRSAADLARRCSVLAVTDFHLKEGTILARKFRKPLVGLRLERNFLPALMDAARHGPLAMIVSETEFVPAFKRALGQLGLEREHLDRIRVADGAIRADAARAMAGADAVYISPLCDRVVRSLAPQAARLLDFSHHIATESIEELEAWLLLSGNGGGG